MKIGVSAGLLLLLWAVLAGGCQLSAGARQGALEAGRSGIEGWPEPTAALLKYELPATATPWPTFTPVPTAVVLAASGAGGELDVDRPGSDAAVALALVAPTATPSALPEVKQIDRVSPVATVTPAPPAPEVVMSPPRSVRQGDSQGPDEDDGGAVDEAAVDPAAILDYGKLPGLPVHFKEQKLFVNQTAGVLPAIRDGDFSALGEALSVVPTRARFVFWAARWESELEEGESFEFKGWLRLTSYFPNGWARFVHDGPVQTLHDGQTYLVSGWGRDDGQFWQPGRHTVEFLDDATEEVIVDWEFTVYR